MLHSATGSVILEQQIRKNPNKEFCNLKKKSAKTVKGPRMPQTLAVFKNPDEPGSTSLIFRRRWVNERIA